MGGERSVKRSRKTQKRLKRTQKRVKKTQKRYKKRIKKTNKKGGAWYHKVIDRIDVNCYIADIFKKFKTNFPIITGYENYTDIYSLYNIIFYSKKYREILGIDEKKWLTKYTDSFANQINSIETKAGSFLKKNPIAAHDYVFVRSTRDSISLANRQIITDKRDDINITYLSPGENDNLNDSLNILFGWLKYRCGLMGRFYDKNGGWDKMRPREYQSDKTFSSLIIRSTINAKWATEEKQVS